MSGRRLTMAMVLTVLLADHSSLSAQYPAPSAPVDAFAAWEPTVPRDRWSSVRPPSGGDLGRARLRGSETGLLIGAVLGAAAGYGFYTVVCEAVNNNCYDSPLRLTLLGAGIGGALGAIVGSLID